MDKCFSKGNTFSVCRLDTDKMEYVRLYEFVETLEEAYILAQYSMKAHRTSYSQLIFIFPGWNIGIEEKPEMYQKAIELDKKYKEED